MPAQRVGAVFDAYVDHAEMAYGTGSAAAGCSTRRPSFPPARPGGSWCAGTRRRSRRCWPAISPSWTACRPDGSRDLAEQLSFLLEGAMARAGLEGDSRRLHRVRELALQLVDTAGRDPE